MNDPDTILPEHIGEYRIEGKLGVGGMGEVYRAWDDELDRAVAIKLIRADQSESTNAQERFRREAQAIAKLDHPAIVRIHHIQKWQGHHCIVMELVEGETLSALLTDGPLAVERAAPLLRQIAEGLAEAHGQGIVHRDLKTSNVMVTPAGRAKILDFGLAKSLTGQEVSISAPGMIVGTLHTMSPEQATSQPVDARTDLFSLGVLAYELLTGTSPFRAEDARETLTRVIGYRPPPVREVDPEMPPELSDLIDRLLEKDPLRRPTNARDVADFLARWINEEASTATGTAPLESNLPVELAAENGGIAQVETIAGRPFAREDQTSQPWRRIVVAAAVILLVFAGLYAAPWARKPPLTVGVLGFATEETDLETGWVATAITEILSAELRSHRQIQVLRGDWVAQIQRAAGITDKPSADDLARLRAGLTSDLADIIVTGGWKTDGDELRVYLDLRELETGLESTLNVVGNAQDLFAIARDAASEIEDRLGVGKSSQEKARAFTEMLPTRPETLRLYAEGLTDWRGGDFLAARDHLEDALAAEPELPVLHMILGQILWDLGYTIEAKNAARKVLEFSHRLPLTARLETDAISHQNLDDWGNALIAYEALFREHPDELVYGLHRAQMQRLEEQLPETLESLAGLRVDAKGLFGGLVDETEALVRLDVGDLESAKALALQVVRAGQSSGAPFLEANGRLVEAIARERLGEDDEAMEALDQSRNLFDQSGNFRGKLDVFLQKAIGLVQEGNSQLARERFEAYRQFFADRGDEMSEAIVDVNLAHVLINLGEFDEAEMLLKHSAEIFKTRGASREAAQTGLNLGVAYQNNGKLSSAQMSYEQALEVFRELSDRGHIAMLLTNIGEILYSNGDLAGAENRYLEALEIDREIGETGGEAYGFVRLGEVAILRADKAARARFETALERVEEFGDDEVTALARLGLAWLEIEESNAGSAEDQASKAESVFLNVGMSDGATLARIVRARSLLERTPPEVERARNIGTQVELEAADSEDRRVRFEAGVLAARLAALQGAAVRELRQDLERLAAEAEAAGFALDACAARLALGEIEMDLGEIAAGRARLEALHSMAEARGWTLYARRAARRLGP